MKPSMLQRDRDDNGKGTKRDWSYLTVSTSPLLSSSSTSMSQAPDLIGVNTSGSWSSSSSDEFSPANGDGKAGEPAVDVDMTGISPSNKRSKTCDEQQDQQEHANNSFSNDSDACVPVRVSTETFASSGGKPDELNGRDEGTGDDRKIPASAMTTTGTCPEAITAKREGTGSLSSGSHDTGKTARTVQEAQHQSVPRGVIQAEDPVANISLHPSSTSLGDAVNVVGATNVKVIPHMRHNCPSCAFIHGVNLNTLGTGSTLPSAQSISKLSQDIKTNATCCELCWCFLCGIPASQCPRWTSISAQSSSFSSQPHCLASDDGPYGYVWNSIRQGAQAERSPTGAEQAQTLPEDKPCAPTATSSARNATAGKPIKAAENQLHGGPFPPDHELASRSEIVTRCRKCNWYSLFDHRNFKDGDFEYDSMESRTVDWCHHCGRVCSSKDFGKQRADNAVFTCPQNAVPLGSKVIPFKLRSHDPRNFDKYKQNWERDGYTYSPEEMDEETFKHRLGKKPTVENILKMIPIVEEERIPSSGYVDADNNEEAETSKGQRIPGADETAAIILETRNHRALFEELYFFGINCLGRDYSKGIPKGKVLVGGIKATWDHTSRAGEFKVILFLYKGALVNHPTSWPSPKKGTKSTLSRLLGVWYDAFPFALHHLTTTPTVLTTEVHRRRQGEQLKEKWNPLWTRGKDPLCDQLAVLTSREAAAVKEHNLQALQRRTVMHTFKASSGSPSGGGISGSDKSFNGTLRRFFSECIYEDAMNVFREFNVCDSNARFAWGFQEHHGLITRHRTMAMGDEGSSFWDRSRFRSYLRDEDHSLLVENFKYGTHSVYNRTKSFPGLMEQLENLGHPEAPHVDGLNVELLNFQKQAVGWALERENAQGGVQAFLWTKLPRLHGNKLDLYFSPILDVVSFSPPKVIRGGLICEEMGLGKTVISLALILHNPAPAVPISGSSTWDSQPAPGWTVAKKRMASAPKKGSIYSRGTLVVCNVSLVGQWIDEAKSKLKDPGLVYSYHGGSRRRNAAVLARNSIVVTTYQTLASDNTYWRRKADDMDSYVPPCEQIHWWRIIADESHYIRYTTGASNALLSLSAENRWCITGTPINTSIGDLRNQLQFIGFDHVEAMFRKFRPLMQHTGFKDDEDGQGRSVTQEMEEQYGAFLFLMRSIMMRHTMKQTNRATKVDLMSLPPKTERTVIVPFKQEERTHYEVLERNAIKEYMKYRRYPENAFSSLYFSLLGILSPLQIACSGGPIDESRSEFPAGGDGEAGSIDHPIEIKSCSEQNSEPRVPKLEFVSKIRTLLSELTRIRDTEPESKSLVFSKYASTLSRIQKELPKHGLQYRTLSGKMTMANRAKALRDFQSDPPTTIFLLSTRAGAVGINLTQANRVFIMEPSLNPALEAQAIGRVHRLGQHSKVEIVRLVMQDSFETRLQQLFSGRNAATRLSNDDGKQDGSCSQINGHASTDKQEKESVGSIRTDSKKLRKEQFDILFGVNAGAMECSTA